jgi:hypothetical protein
MQTNNYRNVTPKQDAKMKELAAGGYEFNQPYSEAFKRAVMQKDDSYWIFGIDGSMAEMIKPCHDPATGVTEEQNDKIWELGMLGYQVNEPKSISAAGLVMERGSDLWFFGLGGEIMHNPDGLHIKL